MARPNHTSINIDAETAALVDARRRDKETRTARLAEDYTAFIVMLDVGLARARRVLTPAEAALVLDVFNSTLPAQMRDMQRLRARLDDAMVLDGMDKKWGVDAPALLHKIEQLGDLPAYALADWAEGVWAKDDFDVAKEAAIFRGA